MLQGQVQEQLSGVPRRHVLVASISSRSSLWYVFSSNCCLILLTDGKQSHLWFFWSQQQQVTRFTRTVSANSPDLTTAARFAKRPSSVSKAWRRPGRRERATFRNTPCPPICSAWWISCATIVKPSRRTGSGTFWAFSVRVAAPSTLSSNKWSVREHPMQHRRTGHPRKRTHSAM